MAKTPPSPLYNTKNLQDLQPNRLDLRGSLDLFDQLVDANPKPWIFSFGLVFASILGTIKNTRHQNHSFIISLYNKMKWVGVISAGDFIMNRVDLGFWFF